MEAAMVVLLCSLVSIVTASLLLLDPKRNEALHKRPGFTLDKEKALLVVFDGRGRELKVRVGVGSAGPRYSCLVEASAHDKRGTASPLQPNCVRWQAERATLDVALSAADEAITCVDVHWTWHEAPPPSSTVTDCVDLRGGGEAWYGCADSSALPWMLNSGGGGGGGRTGRLFYAAGAPDVGPVAEKLWLSDGGHLVAEMSDGCGSGGGEARAATSLYVELADNGSSLCLSDSPSYRQRYGPGKRLTYVACVARDARSAHGWLTRRRLNASSAAAAPNRGHLDISTGESPVAGDGGEEVAEDGEGAVKEDGEEEDESDGEGEDTWVSPDDLVKADPIWTLPESGVADFVQRVARYGFGHAALLLDENALLLSADELVRRLNAAADALLLEPNGTASGGARLGVVVSPAVGIGSDLALRHLHEPLWFSSQPDDLPLLMHHSASGRASVLLNLTRQLARSVVVDKLTAVANATSAPPALADNERRNASWRMALLVLADAGAASVMALEHHSEVRQESIAEFAASYRGLRRDLMVAGLALDYRVDGGPVPPTPPPSRHRGGVSPFVYLFPPSVRRRSACGLLAHLLAASVAGHAAIDVGPFGGGGADGVSANITIAERRRAYASWLQLAALSSAVHFGLPPWLAAGDGEDDADTVRLAHQLLELRRTVVAPRLRSALRKHASDGTPVYRPLWWDGAPAANASGARKAAAIAAAASTQFFIDDVLFAPTCDSRRRRNIFIPRGYWQDALGEVFVGPDIFSYSPAADCPLPFFIESPVGAA